ncbi:hypothetical protein HHL16_17465 [Pseudoflavitalea sp. G-6-1-2]|uniref:hypothetical protein n=1 Tax=Pseudoflavitalea sp. G-6-1-2 TaxID=2728841 RepID=UPI00146D9000|nr:hypothetical protein [Pseudoflavitalea sp. G-6-1-2]NML22676.1 hypothetical protein [Pseudoflavitalea sp. G-6-1-2]
MLLKRQKLAERKFQGSMIERAVAIFESHLKGLQKLSVVCTKLVVVRTEKYPGAKRNQEKES